MNKRKKKGVFFKHLKTILTHKKYVFYYMTMLKMPWRGLLHDMSKFSPVEFREGLKFFQGNRSPIDAAKEKQGFSFAWLHHKGRNPHHYEYWIDGMDVGGIPQLIPFPYAAEMVCDYLAAGQTYLKDKWTEYSPLEYWLEKKYHTAKIHPLLKDFFTEVFEQIASNGLEHTLTREKISAIYHMNVEIPLWTKSIDKTA